MTTRFLLFCYVCVFLVGEGGGGWIAQNSHSLPPSRCLQFVLGGLVQNAALGGRSSFDLVVIRLFLDPKSRLNNNSKLLELAQKAIILYTFRVQVGLLLINTIM